MTPEPWQAKPMTRTELAMLWDLLGQWMALHQGRRHDWADLLRDAIDAELTERFGG